VEAPKQEKRADKRLKRAEAEKVQGWRNDEVCTGVTIDTPKVILALPLLQPGVIPLA
jgi:hypothetical protein